MNDKVSQAIVDAAEKLGFAAERVWPQIVMMTWVTALFWLIIEPILIVITIYLGIRSYAWMRRSMGPDSDSECDAAIAGCIIAGCALFVFMLLYAMSRDLATVLYPEARAVMNLAGK